MVLAVLFVPADHCLQADLMDRVDPACLDFRLVLKDRQVQMVLVGLSTLDLQQIQLDLEVLEDRWDHLIRLVLILPTVH